MTQSRKVTQGCAGLALVLLLSGAAALPASATSMSDIFVGLLKTSANMAKEPYEILSVPFRLHSGGSGSPALQQTTTTTTTTTNTTPGK